ncbi:MAG TPA: ABC transporter permease [Candidatus Avanaerovorax faecigallinarum]|nr:ABC transporter permease [Candidatus Avanaerovorax faecigallinarum]
MNILKEILLGHFIYRKQLFKLAKADIVKTYKGAALGWSWAVIRPAITIFVYWFAFSIGVRVSRDVNGYPYFLWLIGGMIPWFYMRDIFVGGASSLRRYTYLVTKIKFPICTIPTFVNLSLFLINLGLTVIMLILYAAFGYMPDMYYLQLPLYMLMMFLIFNAWALFSAMISAMSRDFLNLIKSVTIALFWLSGIMYDVSTIGVDWIRKLMLFNPITIVVNGYRDSLVYKQWFWEHPSQMRNFIIVYIALIVLSVWAYKKLKKDVPDVL